MKEIKTFETAIKQNAKSLEELGINATLFWAYRTSKETGNELIDFNEVILDYDIVEIAQAFSKPLQLSRNKASAWLALPQLKLATPIGKPASMPSFLQSK